MTINTDDLLTSILDSLDRIQYLKVDEIPNMDLYMDQVTTLMEKKLKASARNADSDKILTKTMINNYAKNNLLPPPVKKKYSREHIIMLIFIYYFKGIVSIGDIQKLLNPLADQYFEGNADFELSDIYTEIIKMEKAQVEKLKTDVTEKLCYSEKVFSTSDAEEQKFLDTFAFICILSFDVYIKKLLIEKLIDELPDVDKK
ncbi:MAG: DUF1836 domain-containing protein [Lachnospiraceae bacterium]